MTSSLRRRRAPLVLALVIVATGLLAAPSATAADGSEIYLVQGLPGEVVDVVVDGETVARDVATSEVVGPFGVDAGSSEVVFLDTAGEAVARNSVDVKAGASLDVVVHLAETGNDETMVTVFDNDLTAVPADKASLTVAHTAAVPPADIVVDGQVLFANVANGESLNLVVPVDTYEVAIVPAGEDGPAVLGPLVLTVEGGSLNRIYAVGDPSTQTMNVAVHIIEMEPIGSQAPERVDTGTGGQARMVAMVSRVVQAMAALLR